MKQRIISFLTAVLLCIGTVGICQQAEIEVDSDSDVATVNKDPEAANQEGIEADTAKAEQGDAETETAETINSVREAADAGDAGAMYKLGLRYIEGNDIEKNATVGFNWCLKAAEKGNVDAQCLVADCYSIGVPSAGVEKDLYKAAEWAHKAKEQGDEYAAVLLKEVKDDIVAIEAEQKRIKDRVEILDGASDLEAELEASGFRVLPPYLQFGSVNLQRKFRTAQNILANSDEFDRPGATRNLQDVETEIKEAKKEIAKKSFLDEYSFSKVGEAKVNENAGTSVLTVRIPTSKKFQNIDQRKPLSVEFPYPDISVTKKSYVAKGGYIELEVSGTIDSIKEIGRNTGNYLVRVRYTNLQGTAEKTTTTQGRFGMRNTNTTPAETFADVQEVRFVNIVGKPTLASTRGIPQETIPDIPIPAAPEFGGQYPDQPNPYTDTRPSNGHSGSTNPSGPSGGNRPVRDAIIREIIPRIPYIPRF